MTYTKYEDWAQSYFGELVEFPDAFRAAFQAGQSSILDRLATKPESQTETQVLEAALFTKAPQLGSRDYSHEVNYQGYHRVLLANAQRATLTDIKFPASQQEESILVSHIALIDENGVIVAVRNPSGALLRLAQIKDEIK
jgi:hypothetical protein